MVDFKALKGQDFVSCGSLSPAQGLACDRCCHACCSPAFEWERWCGLSWESCYSDILIK